MAPLTGLGGEKAEPTFQLPAPASGAREWFAGGGIPAARSSLGWGIVGGQRHVKVATGDTGTKWTSNPNAGDTEAELRRGGQESIRPREKRRARQSGANKCATVREAIPYYLSAATSNPPKHGNNAVAIGGRSQGRHDAASSRDCGLGGAMLGG